MSLKTPLGQVRGLGSAKDGTNHWWMQRLTALALVPLTLWLAVVAVSYSGADYPAAVELVSNPAVTVTLLLLIGAMFYHAQLGLQVVIEDYVHLEWLKLSALIGVKFAAIVAAVVAVMSVMRVSLGN
jgi:succinate dehydrogenase / fumarate reductase membrane anchor subunit